MPDDIYNGLYIHQEMVKGNWYGICSGPKPQVFTGNINNDPESLRNKAIVVVSPSSENGTFPTYGHECAILTTRYGDDNGVIYLQKLFDTQDNVEWDRVYINNSWRGWQRVTTWTNDPSSTANAADERSKNNSVAIDDLYNKIGGRSNTKASTSSATPVVDRVKSNADNINQLTNRIGTVEGSIDNLSKGYANDRVARDHSNKIINGDVRSGQLPGIKFYANINDFTISNANSVRVLAKSVCDSWGANNSNSMFFVSNGNNDWSEAHVEGGTWVPDDGSGNRGGWYAVFDRTINVASIRVSWLLIVFNQSIVT